MEGAFVNQEEGYHINTNIIPDTNTQGADQLDLPPGFRFHPTNEELITHYLVPKVVDSNFTATAIGEVNLNSCEPWDLPSKLSTFFISFFSLCLHICLHLFIFIFELYPYEILLRYELMLEFKI